MRRICTAAFLLVAATSFAQLRELKVGDKLPDLELNNIINYKTDKARISDFKDKLLILDFWATWCGPCIAEFPKLDSLQKAFGDKIQVLGVTDQSAKVASDFFTRFKNINKKNPLPSVTGDSVLRQLFKFTYIPHSVWIDGSGTVLAITYAENVTAQNIQAHLSGTAFSLPVKRDAVKPFLSKDPIFVPSIQHYRKEGDAYTLEPDVVDNNTLLVHSTFTRHIPSLTAMNRNDNNRFFALNSTIEGLYSSAFGRFTFEYAYGNRTIWEVKAPALAEKSNATFYRNKNLTAPERKEWERANTYCYELRVPPSFDRNKKFDIMQTELNQVFGELYGIEGALEKRKIKVLALVRTSEVDKISSEDTTAQRELVGGGAYTVKIRNHGTEGLVNMLRNALQALPTLIDETGYTGKIDVELTGELNNLSALNKLLSAYDLAFVEKEAILDVVVVKDKKKIK